ncbi:hypothetical protein [Candidatus Pelagisphaera phototrophica]|uniref:hypothetical protein n=1 Tax=Candidatus Pelagisphaera phototrophica TaxID=2684113 RepID=UPI001A0A65F5|nr:hypothetical protein [Candidatus Pelagisphaera phototrophica]QXD32377.1 hypothetical protein GA004_01210 [Candidatus Pelagisphaera phototrophica]
MPCSETLKCLGAFNNDPQYATENNPAECYGYKFLETLSSFVPVQLPFSETTLLKKAYELGVLYPRIVGTAIEQHIVFDTLFSKQIRQEIEHWFIAGL